MTFKNAKKMETLVLKENSPKIRATLALYNIECCTCCNFNGAVWLNYKDDITHIVHGKGYTDDLFPSTQQEELDRFVAETKDIYYCKDVNEFIEKIKEQQNERQGREGVASQR